MQCRRYLCSKLLAVLITLLSVTGLAARWWSPNGFQRYRDRHLGCYDSATEGDRVSVGEGDTVIVDQGRQRGVVLGDRYAIFQT